MAEAQGRKAAGDRVEEIITATEARIAATGVLPVSMSEVAKEAGVSRTLLYLYFADPQSLIDEVAYRHLGLVKTILGDGQADALSADALFQMADRYLDYLITRGAVLRYIFREQGQGLSLSLRTLALRNALMRKLARISNQLLGLEPRDTYVLAELLTAVPEELARLVNEEGLGKDIAHRTSDRLIRDALKPMLEG